MVCTRPPVVNSTTRIILFARGFVHTENNSIIISKQSFFTEEFAYWNYHYLEVDNKCNSKLWKVAWMYISITKPHAHKYMCDTENHSTYLSKRKVLFSRENSYFDWPISMYCVVILKTLLCIWKVLKCNKLHAAENVWIRNSTEIIQVQLACLQ